MRDSTIAIRGGQLIDGTGADPVRNALIVLEGGRVTYAGPESGRTAPRDGRVIDAEGASVLPGLMDAHVHISLNAPDNLLQEVTSRSLGEIAYDLARNLRETVAAGVTTIRTVSDLGHLDIAAMRSIKRGVLVGPRMQTCGRGLTCTGGHGDLMPCWLCQTHGDIAEVADGIDAIRGAIRRQAKAGATWIKLFQTGGVVDPHGRLDAEEFTPSEFDAAVETAHQAGLPIAVHAHNKPAILRSIRSGCRSIEHGMHFDEECAELATEHGAYLVPTLTVMDRILRLGSQAGIADYMIENVRTRTAKHHEYVRHAYKSGVPIACGTDAGSLLTPHGSAGREVVQLVKAGLTPVEAIQVATHGTARMLKMDGHVGCLTEGLFGDVIVVEGDVERQPERLELASNMREVMLAGQSVARSGQLILH
jgi:imidazolonepropionase-like amidohydrolase